MPADLADPATWGVTLHEAKLNGQRQRWADTASSEADRGRPVILFMHGWPESWFSWRHQLKAAHAAGYRGIAPDMRGYGGSSAPEHAADYNVYSLAGDMLALLQRAGAERAALVGHDHGALLGWKLALLHPDVFVCYVGMSVPYAGKGTTAPLQLMRSLFGDERKPESDPQFFYILHHQLPNAAADYAQDTRAALLVLYSGLSGVKSAGPAPVQSSKLFVDGKSEPAWRRQPLPQELPPWLAPAELEYFAKEFERTGWDGGLNWYRVLDLDWNATPQLAGRKLKQPVAFITGSNDPVIMMNGGKSAVEKGLRSTCESLDLVKFIGGAGHWVQQERPREVSEAVLEFVGRHRSRLLAGGPTGAAAAPRSRL
mmetsp:Transcript_16284/g.47623  ORF Transcript_16284/g.47623 Transcript_16284/m.47623 type:complete len:370 (-) Transcript_16284:28-1137(-)